MQTFLGAAIVCCTLVGAVDPDWQTVRDNILADLTPQVPTPNMDNEVDFLVKTLQSNGTWPDVNYNDPDGRSWWETGIHLQRMRMLASTHASPHSKHFNDSVVLSSAKSAMLFWVTADIQNSNWWWNDIGTPSAVADALLLIDDASLLEKATPIFDRASIARAESMTGANRCWIATANILRAAASGNVTLMGEGFAVAYSAVEISSAMGDDGIQVDGSFHQHSAGGRGQLYSGWGYGAIASTNWLLLERWSSGTRFVMPNETWNDLMSLVLTGQQLIVRGPNFDWTASGRLATYFAAFDQWGVDQGHYHYFAAFSAFPLAFPTFEEPTVTPLAVEYAPLLSGDWTKKVPRGDELANFGRRIYGDPDAEPIPSLNLHFFDSDYQVTHRKEWYASVRMFSNRSIASECVNDEGKLFRDQSDAVLVVARTGREFEKVFPVLDYHRLPGTTEHQTGMPYSCGDVEAIRHTSFVGGVSDGRVGATAMDFERGHETTLWIGKSYVFLDDVIVGLGASLGSVGDPLYTVSTTLAQQNLNGSVHYATAVGGKPGPLTALANNTNYTDSSLAYVWHDNVAYALWDGSGDSPSTTFPGVAGYVSSSVQIGSLANITQGPPNVIEKSVFAAGIDHGILGPNKNSSYAFAVLPDAPLSTVATQISTLSSRITLLANQRSTGTEAGVQALCDRGDTSNNVSSVLALIAWPSLDKPFGPPGYITAKASGSAAGCFDASIDVEGLVLIRRDTESPNVIISASNPMGERHPLNGTVTIYNQKLTGPGCTVDSNGNTIVSMPFPASPNAAGKTITRICHP